MDEPISASFQPGVFAFAATGVGPVFVRKPGVCWLLQSILNGNGGGGTTGATRPQSDSFAPSWKSAPVGPASSSAMNCFRLFPVTRRTTSPIRCP